MKINHEIPKTESGNNLGLPEKLSTRISVILYTGFVALITTYNLLSLFTPFLTFSKSVKVLSLLITLIVFFLGYYLLFCKYLKLKSARERRNRHKHTLIAAIFATILFTLTYAHLPLYPISLQIEISTTTKLAYFQTRIKQSNDTLNQLVFTQSSGEWNTVGSELVHQGTSPGKLTYEGLVYVSDNTQFSFLFLPQETETSATIQLNQNEYNIEIPSTHEYEGYYMHNVLIPQLSPFSSLSQIWLAVFPAMRWLFLFIHFLFASILIGLNNKKNKRVVLSYILLLTTGFLFYNALLFQNEFINFQTFNIVLLIVSMIVFLLFPLLLLWVLDRNNKLISIIIISIFALAIAIRLYWIKMVPTAQVSDFGLFHNWALQLARGEGNLYIDRYATFTRLLSLLYKLYPSHKLVEVINIFFSSLTMFSIWQIGISIDHEKEGILGAYLFAVFPSQISMVSIVCTDIIAVGLFSLCVLLLFLFLQKDKFIFLFLSAFVFGVSLAIRMPLIIFSPVFLLIFKKIQKPARIKRGVIHIAILLTSTIVSLVIIKGIANTIRVSDMVVEEGRNIIWPLLNGTNIESLGRNNPGDDYLVHSWSEDEAFTKGIPLVIKRVIGNPVGFAKMLKYKFSYMFGDATYGANTAFLGEEMNYYTFNTNWPFDTSAIRYHFAAISQYSLLIILGWAALFPIFSYDSSNKEIIIGVLLVLLSSLLFYSIFEVQPRYQRPIIPSLLILASMSIRKVKDKLFFEKC